MAHHAYYAIDEAESGIARSRAYAETALGLSGASNPDVVIFRYGLLSVEDARAIADIAVRAPVTGEQKAIIVSATRLFHEAQNSFLKLFEEPPAGTTLILVIPAEGMLLPTLRSRLLPLPETDAGRKTLTARARAFLAAPSAEREKLVAKLLDRSKSDKEDEKQGARAEAIQLVEGCVIAVHELQSAGRDGSALSQLQEDLHAFLPILHERSAPLKLIFEHLLLVIPEGAAEAVV